MKSITNKTIIAAIISVVAVAIIAISVLVANSVFFKKPVVSNNTDTSTQPSDVSITKIEPIDSDRTGVALKSEFKLLCNRDCNESTLKNVLNITPKQEYSVKKVSEKEYRLSFNEGLKSNSIYRFEIANDKKTSRPSSWAFQTKKSFKVVRSLPRDKAVSVPLNSGIEITLSHENYENIDKYFEIEPNIKGRFEYHKKVAVFVPEKLDAGTVYTVTIKKGLPLKDTSEKTEQDFVFRFQTENNNPVSASLNYISFSERFYNFTTRIAPTLEINTDSENKGSDVSVEVLKCQSEDEFEKNVKKYQTTPYWAYVDDSNFKYDMEKLVKVSSFKTKMVKNDESYNEISYVNFPESMQEGLYLIKLTMKESSCYTLLQVNNASTYISIGKDKTLVWVNDSVTGNPVAGASVKAEGKDVVKTDKDGIAIVPGIIPISSSDKVYTFKISIEEKPAFFAIVKRSNFMDVTGEDYTSDIYWTHLYLDRGMYLPRDTVRVWGLAKPRGNKSLPDKAVLQVYKEEYYYYEENELPSLDSKEITINKSGTFSDEIKLDNLDAGYYSIRLMFGDRVIALQSFQVEEYTKPAYKIDVKPDKNAMFLWEAANYDIQASFFEGSPVSGIKLKYYSNKGTPSEGIIKCGDDGHGSLKISPVLTSKSWQPEYMNLRVGNSEAEEREISSSADVFVFPRDTMFEVDAQKNGKKGVVEVKTSLIDLDKIKGSEEYYFSPDDYRGNAVNKNIKAKVYESHWESREVGEYYDFINKKKEKKYDYYEVKNVINQLSFSTVNGKYRFEFPLMDENNIYREYFVEISGYDSNQREVVETAYIYSPYYGYPSQNRKYTIVEESGKNAFKTGDNINLKVKYSGEDVKPGPKSRVLFLTQKNGLVRYNISTDAKYSFNMDKECIPNIYMQAVYFDGTNVFLAGSREIRYDYSEKELKINVKADKEEYKPGDTVNLDVEVKDITGNPCAAEVNLSVVDEAFFAIQPQRVNTLDSLYGVSVTSGEIESYVSYKPFDSNPYGGAECGEGGDSGTRTIFKDNAFFGTVKTGGDGKAKASFKIPDNLTSWRITYQGMTDDLKAGSGKKNISVKLPFFVDVVFNTVFLENDSPCISARTYGTDLKSSDPVEYEILMENRDGLKKTFKATGKANLFTSVSLGSLRKGEYSVTVKTKCKNYSDGVKKEFKVAENLLEAGKTKSCKLMDNIRIEGGKSLTTLEFYNKDASLLNETLYSLLYTWGERVDQKLCRKIAAELLKKYYSEDSYYSEDFDLSRYQLSDGGIALLKYDSSDPELSAKISSIARDEFDKNMLGIYFYNILDKKDSTIEDIVSAYWGLATLNEPVLEDIKNLLKEPEIKLKEKLHLILALAEMGDLSAAGEEYSETVMKSMKSIDSMAYIDTASGRDDIIEATSICAGIALKLGTEEKSALFKYVLENSTEDLLTNCEKMKFAARLLPDTQQVGKFTYELDGKNNDVTLNGTEKYRLVLTAEKLGKVKFKGVNGDIEVLSRFTGSVKDSIEEKNNLVKLKRTYTSGNKSRNAFNQSDLVAVTLLPEFSDTAPDGYYEVTDILPCGLRYVEGKPYEDTRYYPDEVSGQKVVFGIYYSRNSYEKKDITYYARAVSPGEFTADNAIIKHYMSNAAGFAEKTGISILK